MNNIISVTGITGHSGSNFLQELVNNRYSGTVRCLVRETTDTSQLDNAPINVVKVFGDITDPEALQKLVENADVVLHIANIHYSIPIVNVCIAEHVPRVILVHTTGIYSKYKMAADEYKQIEKEIAQITMDNEIKMVILRPTMIFGDVCDHNISRFIKMVDHFLWMPEINHGVRKIQPINARDLGKAYFQVCMTDNLQQNDYILSGERAITLHELFDLIGICLRKKIRHISIPLSVGTFCAHCLKFVSFGRIDYIERVLRMGEDRDFAHSEATRDFGFCPEPFEIGLKREVEEYLLRGKK